MTRFCSLQGLAVFGAAMYTSVAFSGISRAQYLKPGQTAPAPKLRDVTEWINSDPLTMNKLRGKVGLVSSSNRNGTTSSASLASAEWLLGESLRLLVSVGRRSGAR